MGISIQEFQIAMEVYGANRLPNTSGTRYPVTVPCFEVNGTYFQHSGSYYIVQRGHQASEEIMNTAMAEFGEKHPGGSNYWWGEIHSIKGILTLAAMLDGKYDKEKVNEMAGETYKRLLDNTKLREIYDFPYWNSLDPKFAELQMLLQKFSRMVNPFGNTDITLRDPSEYIGKIDVGVATNDGRNPYARLTLCSGKSIDTDMHNNKDGVSYCTTLNIQEGRKNFYIILTHYYKPAENGKEDDEVVYLDYNLDVHDYKTHPEDIDLRISLKTGLAWKTYHEEDAHPATDEELTTMVKYLKTCMNKINRRILRFMIK